MLTHGRIGWIEKCYKNVLYRPWLSFGHVIETVSEIEAAWCDLTNGTVFFYYLLASFLHATSNNF